MEAILDFINSKVREEHGNRITIDSMWIDANVDSFGTTMVFLEMDEKYGCFDKDWLSASKISELSIKEIVKKVLDESTKL